MSKMNELSISELEDSYAEHVIEQRQELRKEGAEALRAELLKELNVLVSRAWTTHEKHGYQTAIVLVERTLI
jgi:hypothetical protein